MQVGRGARFTKLIPVSRGYAIPWAGYAYIATIVLIALGAINSGNNLLFWAFGLGVGGVIVSGLISGTMMMGVELERAVPSHGACGEPFAVIHRVKNVRRWMPVFGLTIEEVPAAQRRALRSRAVATWPSVFPMWAALRSFVAYVPPGESVEARAEGVPNRRGEISFDVVRVTTTFPFGLVRKSVYFREASGRAASSVVLPLVVRLVSGAWGASGAEARLGRGQRPREGVNEEFFSLREFVEGDQLRSIAWKASSRLGVPLVRQSVPPQGGNVKLALATSGAKGVELERAVTLAASIVAEASREGRNIRLDIGSSASSGSSSEHAGGRASLIAMLEALARYRGEESSPRGGERGRRRDETHVVVTATSNGTASDNRGRDGRGLDGVVRVSATDLEALAIPSERAKLELLAEVDGKAMDSTRNRNGRSAEVMAMGGGGASADQGGGGGA
ncbi:MAG: DUF58 domain-containing protein [Planctomycetota bacterium]|nr:DUF58 domain-containing protein [Planctomycetota bacterium]